MTQQGIIPGTVVGYIRVSTMDQHQSVEAQRLEIQAWCQAHHRPLLDIFTDEGISGGAPLEKRRGLLLALEALEAGSILVVTKRDRLARDVMTAGMVERLCQKKGASIESLDGVGNGDDPYAEMVRGIMNTFAQFERALIRLRVQNGMDHKRAKGERMSRHLPYGMELGSDGKALVPCAGEQAIIARAKTLHTQGLSLRKMAMALADQGMLSRAGTPFTPSTLQSFLAA